MGHTPGPWVIGDVQWIMHQKSGLGYSYRPINAGSFEVAQVWEDYGDGEMEDNVRLIAAAPELLAALKDLRAFVSDNLIFSPEVAVADRAIAKAEGRSE